ncbi:zinc finger CCHC domain-containing protein 8-like [Dryobates pubescens]|uniref:zinc finger CCHC domain-containing protein 8-like n=1 Tax=Dryobates pubescens TaxID=118200 RepID=UPI0023B89F6F|nr:zinc finger CCHC domain-containing protein 8-like [Dryobates pubescens]
MAAEVDFGDSELFEQLDGEDGLPPTPRLNLEAEERPGKDLEELHERLRDREETVRRLRAENILMGEPGPAAGRAR